MSRPNSDALRVVVAGTGFGCRIQIPALRGAGFDVVALVGADADRTASRAEANHVPAAFTDLDEAIRQTGANVVAIASPPHTHGPLTLAALAHGCHVLCEKPFAKDLAEARAMLEAAQRAGVAHMIGNEFRFVPQRAAIARAIGEGRIGEPKFANLTQFTGYVTSFEDNIPAWWFDPEAGGGWLGASGSHMIDLIRSWMGEFASVSAGLPTLAATRGPVEDSYVVRFRLANGAEGVLQQTAGSWGPPAEITRVEGTKGAIWIEGSNAGFGKSIVWIADRDGARELDIPADLVLDPPPPASDDPRQATAEWQILTQIELPPYTRLCTLFRAAIEGREIATGTSAASFADGVACMQVIDAIRRSAAQGGALIDVGAA